MDITILFLKLLFAKFTTNYSKIGDSSDVKLAVKI